MDALDYILDGLEAVLALERELGVRAVAFDRALLAAPAPAPARAPARPPVSAPAPALAPAPEPVSAPAPAPAAERFDFVFLHDRPFSEPAGAMMAKIVAAMKKTPWTAPAVFEGARPPARVCVLLGERALRKWLPGVSAAPGAWVTMPDGTPALVTYSPEYILRFGTTVTPALKKIKEEMWRSLKGVMARVA